MPLDERERMSSLRESQILDTPPEESFDDIARLAAELCDMPIAAVSFIDGDRQWFKARVGISVESTTRDESFCAHTISMTGPMVVSDATKDERFASNPGVTADGGIRFYAGIPLHINNGSALGALCVADRQTRELTDKQLDGLQTLARHIMRELKLRRDLAHARRQADPEKPAIEEGDLILNTWRLVRTIGEGAVGVVFEARDPEGRRVAIKFLRPQWIENHEVVERFAREARILGRLSSTHVSRILNVGNLPASQGNLPFIVMEFLEGQDLEQILQRAGRVPWRTVLPWVIDLCDVLAEAHQQGITHRDLKPANVLLARGESGGQTIKILDFGIAKEAVPSAEAPLTTAGRILGSLPYMSPEQLRSSDEADARSDIWSLGVVLYEMITGQLPFKGDTLLAICLAVTTKPPLPMQATGVRVPMVVEAVVRQCLLRDPTARFASLEDLGRALRDLLAVP